MKRLVDVAGMAVVVAALVVVGRWVLFSIPLTDDEYAWCQGNWHLGLNAEELRLSNSGPNWYFRNMGQPESAETIRVCRSAGLHRLFTP